MRMDRQLRTVKQQLLFTSLAARHADRREILHLEIADLVGLVLDVDPAELRPGKFFRQREKSRPVFDAGIAPLGAKATHDQHA